MILPEITLLGWNYDQEFLAVMEQIRNWSLTNYTDNLTNIQFSLDIRPYPNSFSTAAIQLTLKFYSKHLYYLFKLAIDEKLYEPYIKSIIFNGAV